MAQNKGRREREEINNSLVYTGRRMTLSNTGHHNKMSGEPFRRAFFGGVQILGRQNILPQKYFEYCVQDEISSTEILFWPKSQLS